MNALIYVLNRIKTVEPLVKQLPQGVKARLCIDYSPISSNELAAIAHGMNSKLTPEQRALYGEEKAAKMEEVFGELLQFKLKERIDVPRLMCLTALMDAFEKKGYNLGLEDISVDQPAELSELDRIALDMPTGAPTEGSLLVIYFEPEA